MAPPERLTVKPLNWIALAYVAEFVATAASGVHVVVAALLLLGASTMALKASLVALRVSEYLGVSARASAAVMAFSAVAQATLAIASPGDAETGASLFLLSSAAYAFSARRLLETVNSKTSTGSVLVVVGALLGGLAPSLTWLAAGLLIYLLGLHYILTGLVEESDNNE